MNKIGYNIHNQMHEQRAWSAAEEQYFFEHLGRLKPPTLLFMDAQSRALNAKALLPDCAVVVRNWRADEGALHLNVSPQTIFEQYKNTPRNLILNLLNEPSGYGNLKELAHWCAVVMDLFGAVGQAIIVPHFGEGHPDVDRLGELEELWKAFDKWHGLHYYGTHEYGTYRGMLYKDGGKYDVFPWRVGRFETFIVPWLKAHGHSVPRVILTEAGCDSAHDGTPNRGWRSSWDETRYFNELKLAVEAVYKQPHYVGLCLFCYGNTGKDFTENDWRTFDVSDARQLHGLLEAYAKEGTTLPPVTQPPPIPPVTPPTPPPDNALLQSAINEATIIRDSSIRLLATLNKLKGS